MISAVDHDGGRDRHRAGRRPLGDRPRRPRRRPRQRQRDVPRRADAPAADPAAGLRRDPAGRRRDRAEPVRQAREARHRPAGLERRDRPGRSGFAAQRCWPTRSPGSCSAITQPIRIGDSVEIEEVSGRVDDITLAYTFIDPGDGRLMVVPNEKVASSVIFNRSTGDRSAPASVSVWVPAGRRPRQGAGGARGARGQRGRRRRDHHRWRADRGPRGQRPRPDRVGGEEAVLRERSHQALRWPAGLLRAPDRASRLIDRRALATLFGELMSPRARRRQRRSRGSPRQEDRCSDSRSSSRWSASAVASVGLWVLDVARRRRRSIDELKPIDKGENSTIFAADGSRLGFIQSDSIREQVPLDEIPEDAAAGHHRDRGRELLRARRRRLPGGRPRGGREHRGRRGQAGRLDDHPAARPQPLHPGPRGHHRAQDPARPSSPRSSRRSTPRSGSSSSTSTPPPTGPTTAAPRSASRPPSQVYFSKPVEDLNLRRGGAARRAAAGALAVQPASTAPTRRRERRNDGPARDVRAGLHHARGGDRRRSTPDLGLERGYRYETIREPYFFNYVEQELIDELRRQHRAPGRARGLHHDQPAACRRSPSRPSTTASRRSAGPPARWCRSTSTPATSSRWPRRATFAERNFNLAAQGHRQPGLLVQAVRARDGDPRGDRPRHAPTTAAPARSASAWAPTRRRGSSTTRARPSQRHAQPAPPRRPTRPTPSTPSSPSTSGPRTSPTWPRTWASPRRSRAVPAETHRRPRRRRLAARDGERLRDLRQRRRPQPGRPRSPRSTSPTATTDEPDPAETQPRAHRRRGLRGHAGPRDRGRQRHRRPPRTTAAPTSPARPARRTRTPTPGSSATRRTSRRPSGSATPTAGPRSAPPPSVAPTRRRSGTSSCRQADPECASFDIPDRACPI